MRKQMSTSSECQAYERKKTTKTSQFANINPLSIEDRAKAVREAFSSFTRDCPFYNERVRSKCSIDPHVIFIPECFGRSFSNGICCPKIILSSFCK
jgi:hypothetical protein